MTQQTKSSQFKKWRMKRASQLPQMLTRYYRTWMFSKHHLLSITTNNIYEIKDYTIKVLKLDVIVYIKYQMDAVYLIIIKRVVLKHSHNNDVVWFLIYFIQSVNKWFKSFKPILIQQYIMKSSYVRWRPYNNCQISSSFYV